MKGGPIGEGGAIGEGAAFPAPKLVGRANVRTSEGVRQGDHFAQADSLARSPDGARCVFGWLAGEFRHEEPSSSSSKAVFVLNPIFFRGGGAHAEPCGGPEEVGRRRRPEVAGARGCKLAGPISCSAPGRDSRARAFPVRAAPFGRPRGARVRTWPAWPRSLSVYLHAACTWLSRKRAFYFAPQIHISQASTRPIRLPVVLSSRPPLWEPEAARNHRPTRPTDRPTDRDHHVQSTARMAAARTQGATQRAPTKGAQFVHKEEGDICYER